jgi:hypothetical protein
VIKKVKTVRKGNISYIEDVKVLALLVETHSPIAK